MVFTDKIGEIDRLIETKRSKWMLTNLLSFEDLAQILRIHIYEKFSQWDQTRPFSPWCSTVIGNIIKNEIRNRYGRLTPPCIRGKGCPFNTGEDGCQWTRSGKKDGSCPAYAKWESSKKPAYELKTASSLEDYDGATREPDFDMIKSVDKFHELIQKNLSERLKQAYQYFYIDHLTDEQAAAKLGFKTKEKNRRPGYRQISNLKSDIFKVAKKLLEDFEVEY